MKPRQFAVVIAGKKYDVMHLFSDRRAIVEYEGALVMADRGPVGWELSGEPASDEEKLALADVRCKELLGAELTVWAPSGADLGAVTALVEEKLAEAMKGHEVGGVATPSDDSEE